MQPDFRFLLYGLKPPAMHGMRFLLTAAWRVNFMGRGFAFSIPLPRHQSNLPG